MNNKKSLVIIIIGHNPYVCPSPKGDFTREEHDFFEAISGTYLPLLNVLESLEKGNIPVKINMVLSPTLCGMLADQKLLERYLKWLEKRIDFGKKEIKRCSENEETKNLPVLYHNQDCARKTALTEQYKMDILGAFCEFQKRGSLEFLLTGATNAYLPFYASMGEAIRAQIETSIIHHRKYFAKTPAGFWLPELGWAGQLGGFLSEYGFTHTITDTHALVMGTPPAETGSFYPVKTPSGLTVFGRDSIAQHDLDNLINAGSCTYRSCHDAGFELPVKSLRPFFGEGKSRCSTGYRYWTGSIEKKHQPYNPEAASNCARGAAKTFLKARLSRLEAATEYLDSPISLCVFDANILLGNWYEGTAFLETLFRETSRGKEPTLCLISDYLSGIKKSSLKVVEPGFSSSLLNGYAEPLLDASNDWAYRHIFRSIHRMVELTERFSADTGLKERALNQAARELLYSQSTDWAKALNPQYQGRVNKDHAQQELEGALRNFTTIYEALGSSHVSTEWLTALERKHNFLPFINHRVFTRKK